METGRQSGSQAQLMAIGHSIRHISRIGTILRGRSGDCKTFRVFRKYARIFLRLLQETAIVAVKRTVNFTLVLSEVEMF